MLYILHSAIKVASCCRSVLLQTCSCSVKTISVSVRFIDLNLIKSISNHQSGSYRWTIKVQDLEDTSQSHEVSQICWDQDLYKIYYEKIYHQQSLRLREISYIRLFRKMLWVVNGGVVVDFIQNLDRNIQQLFVTERFQG